MPEWEVDLGDRFRDANSTRHRNTLAEPISWRFVFQGFPRSLIQLSGHSIQLSLGVNRQIGSFWEVLPQQAIGVFIRAALPRAFGIAEVNLNICR